ncbi:hypothetical protein CYMTET_45742 [Cymbomonas tetramitiformis]|uniref:Uncharacterized protein n=1 Tax=Cymbomonas tetramitiformis TaxID=36881 RepID=A0AAE0BYZ6_9CHLO|nr:hypothetical protein CYMTET_45742 [Cymbomonas tetramitiformis]
MQSKASNELLDLLDILLCKNPDKCFRILESSMRCLPLPFFVLDSVDAEKNRAPTCLYVDKCCEWIGSIITGLHNEGDRCLVEYTNRTLVVCGGIRIVIDDLEPQEARLWNAIERDAHRFFRKVESDNPNGVSFDSTTKGALVKYSSCMLNSRIQEMLRKSSFILQFTVLFLYVKVDVTNRFTVGYKTLMLVCQKSYSQRSITLTAADTRARSESSEYDEEGVARSADHKLQCILDSLFYYWYDLHPAYSTNVWTGSVSRSTVWASCWVEFEYIRSMHPTFSGQRKKTLRGVQWEFRQVTDDRFGMTAYRANKTKDHCHLYTFTCHSEESDAMKGRTWSSSIRRLLDISEDATERQTRCREEARVINVAHLMAALYRKLIGEYAKGDATTFPSSSRDNARKKLINSHKPILYAMHVWGDGFDRVMAHHIEKIVNEREEDGDLLPYARSSAYLQGSQQREDFPWNKHRASAEVVHTVRKRLVQERQDEFNAMCNRVAVFTRTHRAIRNSSEHMDMPFVFWLRCCQERNDEDDLNIRRRILRCYAPQCEHLVDVVENVLSPSTIEPTRFDRTVAKELLHACYMYRDFALALTQIRNAYILEGGDDLAQIVRITRENGRFEEARQLDEARTKGAEIAIIDFSNASSSTGLLNMWHTVYEAMPNWMGTDDSTLLRVNEDLVALTANRRTFRNLREAAIVLEAWSRDTISLDHFLKIVNSIRSVDVTLYAWLLKYLVRTTWLVDSWHSGLLQHAQRTSPTPKESARAKAELRRRMDEVVVNIGDLCDDDFISVLETTNRGETTIAIMKLLKGKRTRTDLPFEEDALVGLFNIFCSCAAETVPVGLSTAESIELFEKMSVNKGGNDELLRKFCTRPFVEWCVQRNTQVRLKSIHCSKRCTDRSARVISAILRTFMCVQYSNRLSPTRIDSISEDARSGESPVEPAHADDAEEEFSSEPFIATRHVLLDRVPALKNTEPIHVPVLTHPFDAFLRDPRSVSHPLWSPYCELFETAACSYPRCTLFSCSPATI